ncbi:MAG: hypothetical protein ACI350_08305 [Prevotella sp.]
MISFCFTIELSRQYISLQYGRENGEHRFLPLEDGISVFPLNTFVEKGEDVSAAVERKLGTFLHLYSIDICNVKEVLPLALLYEDDVDESQRVAFVNALANRGFGNVKVIDKNALLTKSVLNHATALILSSDGNDLFCQLYDTKLHIQKASIVTASAGRDPRVEVLAEHIWSQIVGEAGYLDKVSSMPDIREAAASFLRSGKNEYQGNVFLEGERREYFVRKQHANVINDKDVGSNQILMGITDFINVHGIDKHECTLVLSKGVAGNPYFQSVLNGMFAETCEVDTEWLSTIERMVYEEITQCIAEIGRMVHIADEIPQKNIRFRLNETSIAFNISIPEKASAIEIQRDGMYIRTITSTQFTDTGLQPDHAYQYTFITVITDETGRQHKSKGLRLTLVTCPVNLPDPVSLESSDEGNRVRLTWNKPERGEVKIFWSTQPFCKHCNDRLDLDDFDYPSLSSLDTVHLVEKSFTGERFYLPVTIIGQQGVVGEQQRVTSMVVPSGVRIDNGKTGVIKVVWLWDTIKTIRVRWNVNGENEGWKDVDYAEGVLPEHVFTPSARARGVEIFVSSVYHAHDGSVLESVPVRLNVELKAVNVQYLQAKSEAGLFTKKNRFSITLKAEGALPCDLYLIAGEGSMPLDREHFTSLLTIGQGDLSNGETRKFEFTYNRQDKRVPLFLRLFVADPIFNRRVIMIPETRKI